jgi:hypothetical protein
LAEVRTQGAALAWSDADIERWTGIDEDGVINPAALADDRADARRYPLLMALFVALLRGEAVEAEMFPRVLDARIEGGLDRLIAMLEPVVAGEVPVAAWQQAMAVELRRAHHQAAALGRGGWDAMAPQDWRAVQRRMAEELRYLSRFADELAQGRVSLGQAQVRAGLYQGDIWSSYWEAHTAAMGAEGYTMERRVLGSAEHCADCVGYAAQGWQPIGSLPEPGDGSVCLSNCRCSKEYR